MLLEQYGERVVPPNGGRAGRAAVHHTRWPPGAVYATVNKTYAKGRVAAVRRSLVHGTQRDLQHALEMSPHSTTINTSFVERQNATDRNFNARKARKTYEFSKDLLLHVAVTWWVMFCYNFHHIHRSLRLRKPDETFEHRTPAMAIGLALRPLSVKDMLMTQRVSASAIRTPTLADFRRTGRPAVAP